MIYVYNNIYIIRANYTHKQLTIIKLSNLLVLQFYQPHLNNNASPVFSFDIMAD